MTYQPRSVYLLAVMTLAIYIVGCSNSEEFELLHPLPADRATYISQNPYTAYTEDAFSHPVATLSGPDRGLFAVGNSFFTNAWISAPASASARDGLGPLFSASTCQDCHIRDGRGHIVTPERIDGRLVSQRLGGTSIRIANTDSETTLSHGSHLQLQALPTIQPDAEVSVIWEEIQRLADINVERYVTLRQPTLVIDRWHPATPSQTIYTGLRIAPMVAGSGLIESIPAKDIQRNAQQQQRHYPTIAGKVPWLDDGQLGRFGWRANQPSLMTQTLDAFNKDMGLTSAMFPDHDCGEDKNDCNVAARQETDIDVSTRVADAVVFYLQHLTLPARRQTNHQDVVAGAKVFQQIQCHICHQPSWQTRNEQLPAIDNLTIYPFSDFLLHDMGDELASPVTEGAASTREWRTTPLWGLGYVKAVGGAHAGYLHDGRATTVEEAILWHGGQAAKSREGYQQLTKQQRRQLLRFLSSL